MLHESVTICNQGTSQENSVIVSTDKGFVHMLKNPEDPCLSAHLKPEATVTAD